MQFFDSLEPRTLLASVPSGFTATTVATGLGSPTAMALAPDGRLFVTEQTGAVRVLKNNALLTTPFLTLRVDSSGERGLLGITFDPNFGANRFVYVYYTVPGRRHVSAHNRVSRFTANGDAVTKYSEQILIDLTNLTAASNHNGGAIHFGPADGKLYIATGDNNDGDNAQSIETLLGKILRINPDGSIPADNPFYANATGSNKSIWAIGLRNPFSFSFNPITQQMIINDVGEHTYEEIDEGVAGSNYGWPITEGPTHRARFRAPVFYYTHGIGPTTGQAIVGSAFYSPSTNTFGRKFANTYFFADLASGWIRIFNPATGAVSPFASGIETPVALAVKDNDGSLDYLARGDGDTTGAVVQIQR